jgi:predicted outer membrane repeat protein
MQVSFRGNAARNYGGAIFAQVGCTVTISGNSTFIGNAAVQGEAIAIKGGRVFVDGLLRAQFNAASPFMGGGFVYALHDGESATPGVLQFTDAAAATACVSNNVPDAISLDGVPAGRALCGSSSSSTASWQPGLYNITGVVCACNDAFVAGSATSCRSQCVSPVQPAASLSDCVG